MTTIRSIRVFSAAKVNALLYGILGLLIAPFLLLAPGLAMAGGGKRPAGVAGVVVFAAIVPILDAVFGFCVGAFMAFVYNAISHSVGGIEIELLSAPAVIPVNEPQPPLPSASAAPVVEVPPANPPEFE